MNKKGSKKHSYIHEALVDIRLSWRLYKSNFKVFLGAQIISILVYTFLLFPWELILMFFFGIDFNYNITLLLNIRSLIGGFLISIFFGSSFGLSYDIMSGGDQFTELRGFFHYFKQYWWQYILLSLLLVSGTFLSSFIYGLFFSGPIEDALYVLFLNITIIIIYKVLMYFWITIILQTFPSLTSQGSIKNALHENFKLLRVNSKRILSSLLLFFLIFNFSWTLLQILDLSMRILAVEMRWVWYQNFIQSYSIIFPLIQFLAQTIFIFLLAIPMLALVSTRIYNSLKMGDNKVEE
ncbi:MAG: hypothetical protein KAX10_07585 [Candidatus Lokiarchaeota archaeon]|nr:hypothetical protein [Candidatus Lokiarchaeota archaeon]